MGSKSSSTPIMIEKRTIKNRKPIISDKEINKIDEKKFVNKINAISPKMVSDKKVSETLQPSITVKLDVRQDKTFSTMEKNLISII